MSPSVPCCESCKNRLADTKVHEGVGGAGGRPPRPKTVTTEPLYSHITHWIFQSIAGWMPRSQGAPRIASIAKGTTQKSHGYTTPGANVTCTPCARPRLTYSSPSASLTFKWHEKSTHSPTARATRSLRKLWLAPLSTRVRPSDACLVPPLNHRSNSSSSCWLAIPADLLTYASMGCGQ